ncbi:MAG: hypothetical protein ABI939_02215 [Anaerolineaceae bacterium]
MRSTFLVVLAATLLITGVQTARGQPQLPSTIYGSASIDGEPVRDGTQVRGYIDGNDCTQPSGLSGTVTDGGVSGYVINVMHETQRAGCGKDGKTITFTVGGRAALQSTDWKIGIQRLDINIGQGQPIALPTLTPVPAGPSQLTQTPAASASASSLGQPTGPASTGDGYSGKTPGPPRSSQVTNSGDSSTPVAVILLAALALIAVAGAVAGYLLSRRKPPRTDDSRR